MNAVTDSTLVRPAPERYDDFRAYLRDMVEYLREGGRGFSFRSFASRAGYSSPSFLKLVIDGKSNLSNESIFRFAKALGLRGKEVELFEALVLFTQSKSDEDRNHYYSRLQRTAGPRDPIVQLRKDQYEVYSEWFGLAIREMLNLPGFCEDPAWIASRLNPPVTEAAARRMLNLLIDTGLVHRARDGRLSPSNAILATPDRLRSLAVRNFHRKMLELASSAIDEVPVDERDFSALTLTLSKKQYEAFCEQISAFEDELLQLADAGGDKTDDSEVYHLAVQLIPVTKGSK